MSGGGYELVVQRSALKFLARLVKGNRKTAERIRRDIEALIADPFPNASRQLKNRRLENMPVRRLRCGSYRVLYQVIEESRLIIVRDIDHRKNIYRGSCSVANRAKERQASAGVSRSPL